MSVGSRSPAKCWNAAAGPEVRELTDRRRLQIRVTLDSDMGPLFDWAAAIPERARARELVGLLRVGYAISLGNAGTAVLTAATATELQLKPLTDGRHAAATASASTSTSALNLELQGAEATLEIFDAASVTGVPPP